MASLAHLGENTQVHQQKTCRAHLRNADVLTPRGPRKSRTRHHSVGAWLGAAIPSPIMPAEQHTKWNEQKEADAKGKRALALFLKVAADEEAREAGDYSKDDDDKRRG